MHEAQGGVKSILKSFYIGLNSIKPGLHGHNSEALLYLPIQLTQ